MDLYNDYFWSAWQRSHIGSHSFDWREWHTHAFVRKGDRAAYFINGQQFIASGASGSIRNVDPTTVRFNGGFAGWVDNFELALEAKHDIA